MTDRWRGRRRAGLAAVVLTAAVLAGTVGTTGLAAPRWIVIRDTAGVELARAALPASGTFSLRYRNSLYGSTVEERFRAEGDRLAQVSLAAEELAVLEEYYGATGATHIDAPDDLGWQVDIDRPPVALPLRVQATALGERELVTEGGVVSLWRLVAGRDSTRIVLTVEGA